MKIRSLTIRIPSPRKPLEETPADALRRRLVASAPSTAELRRRLAGS